MNVLAAVESVEGASDVNVDLNSGRVDFEMKNKHQLEQVKLKIKGAGFEI